MDQWTGPVDWTSGLDRWTGLVDWTSEVDQWTGPVDWTSGLDQWTGLVNQHFLHKTYIFLIWLGQISQAFHSLIVIKDLSLKEPGYWSDPTTAVCVC